MANIKILVGSTYGNASQIAEDCADRLQGLGHQVERMNHCGSGATLGVRDPETKVLSVGGDPRRASYALGW